MFSARMICPCLRSNLDSEPVHYRVTQQWIKLLSGLRDFFSSGLPPSRIQPVVVLASSSSVIHIIWAACRCQVLGDQMAKWEGWALMAVRVQLGEYWAQNPKEIISQACKSLSTPQTLAYLPLIFQCHLELVLLISFSFTTDKRALLLLGRHRYKHSWAHPVMKPGKAEPVTWACLLCSTSWNRLACLLCRRVKKQ